MYYQCRHVFPRGVRCKSPALKDQSFCYYHQRVHAAPSPAPVAVAPGSAPGAQPIAIQLLGLEDAAAIQDAISQVLAALAAGTLDARRAQLLLYGLQIASTNARNLRFGSDTTSVRDTIPQSDGSHLAPVTQKRDWGEDISDACNDDDYEDEDEDDDEDDDDVEVEDGPSTQSVVKMGRALATLLAAEAPAPHRPASSPYKKPPQASGKLQRNPSGRKAGTIASS